MMRWLVLASLAAMANGANLEASQQDGIMKLLTASDSPATKQSNVSKTSKVKAKTTQMEDMVLLLAQQAKAAREASKDKGDEEDVKDLLQQLRQELMKMQTEINTAASQSDAACQAAYDNLTGGCAVFGNDTVFYPEGFDGNFTPLRDSHENCRSTLPQKKQDFESCHKIRASLAAQADLIRSSKIVH